MIKYICNRCKNEINKNWVHQITIQNNDSKKVVHLCGGCMRPFNSYLSGGTPDGFVSDDKSTEISAELISTPAPVPVPADSPAPVPNNSSEDKVAPTFQNVNILGKGVGVDEITEFLTNAQYRDNFIEMKPIPVQICEKFFTQEFISFGPRADVLLNIKVILLFYRGVTLSDIGRKFCIGNKQFLEGKLMNHVSLKVYKRWFTGIPDFGIEKNKVPELLAYLTCNMSVKDVMIEVGLDYDSHDDRDTLFTIVEYYIGFGLSDLQKQKFLGKA